MTDTGIDRWWLLAGSIAAVLFVAAVGPSPDLSTAPAGSGGPIAEIGADKWLHAIGSAALTAALARAAVATDSEKPIRFAVAVALAYTTLLESLHYWLPYRLFAVADLAANAVGVVVGIAVVVAARLLDRQVTRS